MYAIYSNPNDLKSSMPGEALELWQAEDAPPTEEPPDAPVVP